MAATRLLMRRLRELLRLKYDAGLSHRAVAQKMPGHTEDHRLVLAHKQPKAFERSLQVAT